jgi:hypothetical protein
VVAAALAAAALAAGGGQTGAVERSIGAYFDALARHDARAACARLTERSREKLGEFGHEHLGTKHESCVEALRALFRSPAGGPKGGHRAHRVRSVRIRGERATARVRNVEGPMRLEREHGERWLIDSEPTGETD